MQTSKDIPFVVYFYLTSSSLLLMVNMELMASLASSREDANKKVDNIFEIVSRPPTDLGLPLEPGKYVTIDDGLNPIFQLPPTLCKTPKVGGSLQEQQSLILTAG